MECLVAHLAVVLDHHVGDRAGFGALALECGVHALAVEWHDLMCCVAYE